MPNEIVATKMEVVYHVDQRYNDDRKVQVEKKRRERSTEQHKIFMYVCRKDE